MMLAIQIMAVLSLLGVSAWLYQDNRRLRKDNMVLSKLFEEQIKSHRSANDMLDEVIGMPTTLERLGG